MAPWRIIRRSTIDRQSLQKEQHLAHPARAESAEDAVRPDVESVGRTAFR